jgi:hypothetical protein
MATKITKSELKQMIREALREELAYGKSLREANTEKQYTMELSAIHNRIDDKYYTDEANEHGLDSDIYRYTSSLQNIVLKLNRLSTNYDILSLYIYELGRDDSVFNGDMIDVEDGSNGLTGDFGPLRVFKNEIIDESEPFMQQFKIEPKGRYTGGAKAVAAPAKAYIIASKANPSANEQMFYHHVGDEYSMHYKTVCLKYLTKDDYYKSLGDARFIANIILSMSDLHRIYILDANTLVEVDSLDYYVDYEDEKAFPGYFDAP